MNRPVGRLAALLALLAALLSSAPAAAAAATWKLVYDQRFSTTATAAQMSSKYGSLVVGYPDGYGTTYGGTYQPSTVLSAHDGYLDMWLHTDPKTGKPVSAAPVPQGWVNQTYGRYEVRFRADVMPGFKQAFLLWPDSDVWNDGEIDWPEGGYASGDRMRPASAVPGSYRDACGCMTFKPDQPSYAPTSHTGWHTAVTEWTPTAVSFFWDGKLIATDTAAVPRVPMHYVLQTERDWYTPKASVQGHVQVDYFKVWSYVR